MALPLATFIFNTYWDGHYRTYPWYTRRGYY